MDFMDEGTLYYDKESALEAVRKMPFELANVSEEVLKKHPEIVAEAVKQDYKTIFYISSELLDNIDVMFAAITENFDLIQFASPRLQGIFDISPFSDKVVDFSWRVAQAVFETNGEWNDIFGDCVEGSVYCDPSFLTLGGLASMSEKELTDLVLESSAGSDFTDLELSNYIKNIRRELNVSGWDLDLGMKDEINKQLREIYDREKALENEEEILYGFSASTIKKLKNGRDLSGLKYDLPLVGKYKSQEPNGDTLLLTELISDADVYVDKEDCEDISDKYKLRYNKEVLSNPEVVKQIKNTLSTRIYDVDEAQELAEVDNFIYDQTHGKSRK